MVCKYFLPLCKLLFHFVFWLGQQTCISSQFWRLEVRIQVWAGLVPPEASLGLETAASPCILTGSPFAGPHVFQALVFLLVS